MIVIAIAISLVATAAFAGPGEGLQDRTSPGLVKASAPNDVTLGLLDCSNAIDIYVGDIIRGDNTDAPNNVTTWGCSDWDESGGEVVYNLHIVDSGLYLLLEGDTCDLDMAALFGCDETDCLFVSDNLITAGPGTNLDITIVVDGYAGAGCPFTLSVLAEEPPPPPVPEVDFCEVVDNLSGTEFSGTTCDGVNQINDLPCRIYLENGLEFYYEVFMPANSTFTADMTSTADGALWVVDGCFADAGENVTCLAYADDSPDFGGPETISYANESGEDMFVYLVIDSWGTDTCGDFDLIIAAQGGAVAVEGVSFGAAKALFR